MPDSNRVGTGGQIVGGAGTTGTEIGEGSTGRHLSGACSVGLESNEWDDSGRVNLIHKGSCIG